jgi:hypothetical protein
MLQTRQKLKVVGTYNGEDRQMGTLYLDKWENVDKKTMQISAIDLLGVIDKTDFMGNIYFNVSFESIVNEIMTSAGLTTEDYTIQDNLKSIVMSGYIPICSHREALQQIVFSVGAVVDCSRSELIKIFTPGTTLISTIGKSSIFQKTMKITQNELVTAVQVLSHNYSQGATQEKLYDGELDVGNNKILFNEPVYNISVTGGTIVESNCNYAIINCTSAGPVVINGYVYQDNIIVHVVETEIEAQQKEHTLTIDNAYFVNKSIANTVAQRILDYYQKTYTTEVSFLLDTEQTANYSEIETDYEQKLIGNITHLDIDLLGGWIADMEVHTKLEQEDSG